MVSTIETVSTIFFSKGYDIVPKRHSRSIPTTKPTRTRNGSKGAGTTNRSFFSVNSKNRNFGSIRKTEITPYILFLPLLGRITPVILGSKPLGNNREKPFPVLASSGFRNASAKSWQRHAEHHRPRGRQAPSPCVRAHALLERASPVRPETHRRSVS